MRGAVQPVPRAMPRHSAGPQVVIETMSAAHIAEVVRLHELCYPTQFSTRLGPGVLTILYRSYCEDPKAPGFVSLVDGRVVAAVCGVIGGGFQQRVVRRHGVALAWQLLRRAMLDPQLALDGARRAISVLSAPRDASGTPPDRFVWRSQTVDPECRGQGVIFPLIRALFEALRARGVAEIYSTPDEDNQAAMWIHRVLNFERHGTQVAPNGKRQPIFILKLTMGAPA